MTTEVTEGAPNVAPEGDQSGAPPTPPVRPDNVPEQFWDAENGVVNTEALLSFYSEVEAAKAAAAKEAEEAAANQAQNQEEKKTAYTQAVEKATAELAESGALSEETYATFEAQGIDRAQIDDYVDAQQARFELRKIHAETAAGGAEAYAELLSWAGANYTPEDAEAYNKAVFGADRDAALAAVASLKTRYEAEMGNDGKIVTPGTGTATPGGYATKTEWLSDMRKPEYKTDPGFREQVRKKMEIALKNGVNLGVSASVG